MLSVAIQSSRARLVESNARTEQLLRHEEALNAAVRQLVQLSEPPQITALGAQLAMGIASPRGSEILRASYFRIEDGMVVVERAVRRCWGRTSRVRGRCAEHPGLREAVATLRAGDRAARPRRAPGRLLRAVLDASGITYGAWVPVCPDGELHGVLAIASRGASIPNGVRRAVRRPRPLPRTGPLQLGRPPHAGGAGHGGGAPADRPRAARRTGPRAGVHRQQDPRCRCRAHATSHDARALAGAADRALDEARRAITVLSVSQPQSLDAAISQTVEDLGSRLGVAWDLQLADDVEVPGDVTENLLRIVREAITNAACHGASEHVRVRLERAERLRLVIEDDGCGFDPEDQGAAGGFGLQSMQERAASVGGVLSVDSVPEHGHAGRGGLLVSAPITVLLADDHARTRALVRNALERTGDFHVCVEAADAAGAVEGAKRERPDVCLLDINMPGNGIAAATQISGALPDTSVVMLTVSRQDEDLFDALRAGASGLSPQGAGRGHHRRRPAAGPGGGGHAARDARRPPGRRVP